MEISRIARLGIAVVIICGGVSCSSRSGSPTDAASSQDCHLIGCQNMFAATISMSGATLKAGVHTIETNAGTSTNSTTRTCSVTVSQAFLQEGLDAASDSVAPTAICDEGIRVEVSAETTCTTVADGGAVSTSSASCVRVPDHFIERVFLADLPSFVHIRQTVGDTTVFDESRPVTYSPFRPNGPTCEPTCQISDFVLALP